MEDGCEPTFDFSEGHEMPTHGHGHGLGWGRIFPGLVVGGVLARAFSQATYAAWSQLPTVPTTPTAPPVLMRACPFCHGAVHPTYVYCPHCGHAVPPPPAPCAYCGQPRASETGECLFCGAGPEKK